MRAKTNDFYLPLPTIYLDVKRGEWRLCEREVQICAEIFGAARIERALAELPVLLRQVSDLLMTEPAQAIKLNRSHTAKRI